MAKLGEILSSIFGADMNKEVDITLPETPAPDNVTATVESMPKVEEVVKTEPTPDYQALLKQRESEIESLKLANKALLTQTPVSDPELTIEDMIYRAVIGEPKGVN